MNSTPNERIRQLLDRAVDRYNGPDFIGQDPVSIPHRFAKREDQEIMGFWTAMLAWGQRKSILASADKLIGLMDGAPHDFVLHHQEKDLQRFEHFVHRTFQPTDSLYFLTFLQHYYRKHASLEDAFARFLPPDAPDVSAAIVGFHELFFSLTDAPDRTRKHVATPLRGSTCKRINMFLRWMVRRDSRGVDLGIWPRIGMHQLLIPLDVHVDRIARKLQLLSRKQTDWLAVLELTEQLRHFSPNDPVQYDFALFGIGVLEGDIDWKQL